MAAGRPRQFDYDDALDQAMKVFWSKGYEGTSMPDLTEAMGMNRPSIYSSFGNKEELFRKALERYSKNAVAFFCEKLDKPTVREALGAFLYGAASTFACPKSPRGCMAVQGALVCSDEAEASRLEALGRREDVVKLLQGRFERGLYDGDLPKGTDAEGLARFYTAIMQGMSVQSAGGATDAQLHMIAANAMKVLP